MGYNRGKKNKGSLVFSFDNRSAYGNVAPADLSNEIGYIGPTAVLFGDADTVLVDFNWQQFFNDGNTSILIGRYDPSDYLNILGYANPWAKFQNLNVVLDSSVAYPDFGFGAGVGHWFNTNWYGVTGFNDANGELDDAFAPVFLRTDSAVRCSFACGRAPLRRSADRNSENGLAARDGTSRNG